MDAGPAKQRIYQGEAGYVTVDIVEANGVSGAVFHYVNPDPRKLQAVDSTGMLEMYNGVEAIEARADELRFAVFYGSYDQIHAGADITEFAGDPDYDQIQGHLDRGTSLDTRVKKLWPKLRTVGVFCGDRYGGSVEWPLFAEWGICDSATRIQFTEVHLGIVPGWNGVLNTMMKSGGFNARYMASTGNPVSAEQMKDMGIVQSVVSVPDAPNRREVPRDEWSAVWAAHAETCTDLLLNAAIQLATDPAAQVRSTGFSLATDQELAAELASRMNVSEYEKLRSWIASEAAALDPDTQQDEIKALNKRALGELGKLGKPLAPGAVDVVKSFTTDYCGLSRADLMERFDEIGHVEAKQCGDLMRTRHRRIGVGAVLARNPAEKIPVFD